MRILLFAMLCGSLLVLITNLYAFRKAKRLETVGKRVEGECVQHYWPSGGYVGVICAYSAGDGEERSVRSSRYTVAPVEIGDPAEVVYDPNDPGRSMLSFEASEKVGFDVALSAVTGAMFVAAVVGLIFTL
ncbi:DUF3592 domain-containing protein [Streptomyces sp. NPDC005786]|uniref:DUF3592 domain-containing protein n=1 Tax=Streptomyces sp. NPDC005786 TaxID=3154891 RepID=UPI00340FCA80